ncbi:site-specific integrase [Methylobacterium sp. J-030]|uniref:site-specific integrase n=1 Tax=Methylobacterium sp. J-030 TaxID=2836627 RepID=UPI001FBBFFB4|nr:site-specific integrase [Methylobacterium sp. J-030]MCJ2068309.1 site-specific integrase [Methylobacterium sp. J-030]
MNLPVPVAPAERASAELVVYSPSFQEALAGAKAFAVSARSERTAEAYRGAFTAFRAWCAVNGVSTELPASVEATVAYLSHMASTGRKPATIRLHVAAIAAAHKAKGFEPPTNNEVAKATVKGIRRTLGTKPNRKAPVTADAMKRMLRKVPADLMGRRDRALLLIGFAAALRRSELVALQVSDLEWADEGVIVTIPRSKTDQEGAGHTVAIPSGSKLKPVEALEAWLKAAGIAEGPVFRSIAKGGRISPHGLTPQSVAAVVKSRAEAAGLDPAIFSGHSLRAGFVTSALAAGADVLKVMDVTRHRSVDTLKVYDRRSRAFRDHAGAKFL